MSAILATTHKYASLVDGTLSVTFHIQPSDALSAVQLFGSHGTSVGIAAIKPEAALEAINEPKQEKELHPYGKHARALIQAGFFNPENREVLRSIGSDEEFRAWIQEQPSCIDGNQDYVDGKAVCEAAHVRRAGESGTNYKAEYACVPLTHAQHIMQHQRGELSLLCANGLRQPIDCSNEAKEWFNKQRIKYVLEWAKSTLARALGYESVGDIPPVKLLAWAEKNDLVRFLPREYREAT